MTNLLPKQIYTEVLLPTEIQSNMPVDHKVRYIIAIPILKVFIYNFLAACCESFLQGEGSSGWNFSERTF